MKKKNINALDGVDNIKLEELKGQMENIRQKIQLRESTLEKCGFQFDAHFYPAFYSTVIMSCEIAGRVVANGTDINDAIDYALHKLKNIMTLYNKIELSDALVVLQENKKKPLGGGALWKIAVEISSFFEAKKMSEKVVGAEKKMRNKLEKLFKMREKCDENMDDVKNLLNRTINLLKDELKEFRMWDEKISIFPDPLNPKTKIDVFRSPTRPRDIDFALLFEGIFSTIKEETGLSNEFICGIIVGLFDDFDILKKDNKGMSGVDEGALLKRLGKKRGLGTLRVKSVDTEKMAEDLLFNVGDICEQIIKIKKEYHNICEREKRERCLRHGVNYNKSCTQGVNAEWMETADNAVWDATVNTVGRDYNDLINSPQMMNNFDSDRFEKIAKELYRRLGMGCNS